MDNQHRKISGYRELSQEEIDLMNEIKAFGGPLAELCSKVAITATNEYDQDTKRWAAIGRTHLQEGLMALTRAVAKPTVF